MKDLFQVSDTRGGGEYTVGRVVSLESSGEILIDNYRKVILDRKHFSFLMQVIDRDHPNTYSTTFCKQSILTNIFSN